MINLYCASSHWKGKWNYWIVSVPGHRAVGKRRYSSKHFSLSALDKRRL